MLTSFQGQACHGRDPAVILARWIFLTMGTAEFMSAFLFSPKHTH